MLGEHPTERQTINDPFDDFLEPELSAMVEAELAKGERVEWIGRPIPWLRARASLPTALVGIPVTAFALFWISVASGFRFPRFNGPPDFFPLFGLLFVGYGLVLLMSPLWAYRKALGAVYAITDRRALTIERDPLGRVMVRSFQPPALAALTRTQNGDGSGDLVFQREYRHRGNNRRPYIVNIGFLGVADVKDVEERIHDLIRDANGRVGDTR